MGLAVAKVLADKGWRCVLLDMNAEAGAAAVASVPNSDFITTNVTSWDSLSSAFDASFEKHGTLDFVFANAGIVERDNFYEKPAAGIWEGRIPPRPNQSSIDVNLKAVIDTSYLAQHYFRLSPHHGRNACLVMTASVGGLVSNASIQAFFSCAWLTTCSILHSSVLCTLHQKQGSSISCDRSRSRITIMTEYDAMRLALGRFGPTCSTLWNGQHSQTSTSHPLSL